MARSPAKSSAKSFNRLAQPCELQGRDLARLGTAQARERCCMHGPRSFHLAPCQSRWPPHTLIRREPPQASGQQAQAGQPVRRQACRSYRCKVKPAPAALHVLARTDPSPSAVEPVTLETGTSRMPRVAPNSFRRRTALIGAPPALLLLPRRLFEYSVGSAVRSTMRYRHLPPKPAQSSQHETEWPLPTPRLQSAQIRSGAGRTRCKSAAVYE